MTTSASNSIQTPAAAPRIDWVDNAKGLCIILVVMMHTTLGLEHASGEEGWMHAVVEFAKPFRMPDFFMISGLFLAATINRPWRLYGDRKVAHFFYFYFLWVAIQFAFKAPFMMADGTSVATIIRSLLFTVVQPFGTLWFIYMLPVFFVVTKLFRSKPWILFGVAALLQILPINTQGAMSSVAATLGVISVDNYWVLLDEFCSFYVYFLAGYLFAPHIFRLAQWAGNEIVMAVFVLIGWFFVNLALVLTGWAFLPLISLALGGGGAVAIVILARLLSQLKIANALTYLGANSIVIYLSFFIPMVITRLVMLKFIPWIDPGTMAALAITIAVVTPLIGYEIIRKTGFGLFLFHRPAWAILANKPTPSNTSLIAAE